MKYYFNLYMDKKIAPNKETIIRKLEHDKWQLELYLIVLPRNEMNHLEIYNSALLLQKAVSKEDLFIVGLASGYHEALNLVEKITREVYDETKGTDIRNYILQNQKEFEEGNV